ncbi:Spy/CpxP family protein refolding chaperone [Caulobacter ginsengisoli]|uniref:Spy/CpxP family protein refolding chaperone n=1 Tax=Caulobacter ginsengisoli TaxID=400775 RepID=A0ABU0ISD5_9CAUL|nr:Spy/CpxP family protein refolding chaperone [Caulobacter ginsengisoli]MDQ0464919.1 Spy/CpxP family protein refolding chaperone [Caulobacter ginsengisoli]
MTFNPTRLGLLASAALILTLAGAAQAADTPPPKVERKVVIMGGPGGGMMGGPMGGMGEKMDPAKHAQHLRDVLQLRPDQEGALQAFLKSMEHPKDMGDMPKMDGPMTTPQRLDMMLTMMAKHQAMMEKHVAAVKAFYAQLSPAQQKAFDALHDEMMGGMMGGGGMRMIMRRGPHSDDGGMGPPPPPPGE